MTALAFPSAIYGASKAVRRALSLALKQFNNGSSWNDSVGSGPMLHPSSTHGLIVLNGPAPALAEGNHFHAYLPLRLLLDAAEKGKGPGSRLEEAFNASLETGWGLLGVLSNSNLMLVIPPHRHRAIVDSALVHWDQIESVGPLYSTGLQNGTHFWDVPNNLGYVLGQLGVPPAQLNRRLSGTEMKALLESV